MSHTSNVADVNCIPLMTKIEEYIQAGVVKIIEITRYNIDFAEVKKAVMNICKRLNTVALVFPIYSKNRLVSVHLIPV